MNRDKAITRLHSIFNSELLRKRGIDLELGRLTFLEVEKLIHEIYDNVNITPMMSEVNHIVIINRITELEDYIKFLKVEIFNRFSDVSDRFKELEKPKIICPICKKIVDEIIEEEKDFYTRENFDGCLFTTPDEFSKSGKIPYRSIVTKGCKYCVKQEENK